LDVLTRNLEEDIPWFILAVDSLLIDKTREGVEGKLEVYSPTLLIMEEDPKGN